MTKVNPNNKNETKSDIFRWGIFKSDTKSFLIKNILIYFNDFQNRNFSILWDTATGLGGHAHFHTHEIYFFLYFFNK